MSAKPHPFRRVPSTSASRACSLGSPEAVSVPALRLVNPLKERVLFYEGEELVGAKQNRILESTISSGS